jgi:hypothetical protein
LKALVQILLQKSAEVSDEPWFRDSVLLTEHQRALAMIGWLKINQGQLFY